MFGLNHTTMPGALITFILGTVIIGCIIGLVWDLIEHERRSKDKGKGNAKGKQL